MYHVGMDEHAKLKKRRTYDREWKRQYKLKNPDKVKAKRNERYKREKQSPEWLEKHREYMRAYQAKWRKNNPKYLEYRRKWMREWHRKHRKEIYAKRRQRPYEKLASTIRSRIKDVLKNGYYTPRTAKLLGCSYKELMVHLEKQFEVGMTWKNYGFYGWHVDHILPLSRFDLTKEEEQKKAFHYTNLQPLWAKENLEKHANVL